eukprot:TRINITY_DN12002_c1_g4_i3.p1 TRINITY_DN12002_c1_g4~~TRINITY_DN12002_c1_g4_i3.p1  ORF type:complete len:444 (+),score=82.80 TRINITY_DN12002_c1_g4_i3:134-1465(+)
MDNSSQTTEGSRSSVMTAEFDPLCPMKHPPLSLVYQQRNKNKAGEVYFTQIIKSCKYQFYLWTRCCMPGEAGSGKLHGPYDQIQDALQACQIRTLAAMDQGYDWDRIDFDTVQAYPDVPSEPKQMHCAMLEEPDVFPDYEGPLPNLYNGPSMSPMLKSTFGKVVDPRTRPVKDDNGDDDGDNNDGDEDEESDNDDEENEDENDDEEEDDDDDDDDDDEVRMFKMGEVTFGIDTNDAGSLNPDILYWTVATFSNKEYQEAGLFRAKHTCGGWLWMGVKARNDDGSRTLQWLEGPNKGETIVKTRKQLWLGKTLPLGDFGGESLPFKPTVPEMPSFKFEAYAYESPEDALAQDPRVARATVKKKMRSQLPTQGSKTMPSDPVLPNHLTIKPYPHELRSMTRVKSLTLGGLPVSVIKDCIYSFISICSRFGVPSRVLLGLTHAAYV